MDTQSTLRRMPTLAVPLFWRLFISLLFLLLITSVMSIAIERWINTQALESRMARQVTHLVTVRQDVIQALESGDYDALQQIYRRERRLKDQIVIIDEQGTPLSSRLRWRAGQGNRPPEPPHHSILPFNSIIQDVVPDADNYPELQDISVTSADGYHYTVQLHPRLPLQDLIALRQTHFSVRFAIILFFSLMACYWFSRTLTRRINQVQSAVHRMSEGDYAADDLSQLGDDELGTLAKDVARLSDRLVDSELARKQMLSDISHELRSPLARLDVATELSRDCAPEAMPYLDRIQRESARMNELIAQIIHIQSLQMQRYLSSPTDYEAVDIVRLLNDIGQDVCFEFQDKHITWQCQCFDNECVAKTDMSTQHSAQASIINANAQEPYIVLGNAEQLHSAFENIIRNAFIHSTPFSTVVAQIDFTNTVAQQDKDALKVSIMDQGDGIAKADLVRIFEPFVRLDTARQRPKTTKPVNRSLSTDKSSSHVGGYGLGLAIAQAIIAAHKGHITAQNRQDGRTGLVVEVILPVNV